MLLTQPHTRRSTFGPPDWPELVSRLLSPMHVQTFVAHNGSEAISLVQRYAMHVAVVNADIPDDENYGMDSMTVLRLIQCLQRDSGDGKTSGRMESPERRPGAAPTGGIEKDPAGSRRIPVTGEKISRSEWDQTSASRPLVILLAPLRTDRLMREALRRDVFSVLPAPVNLNELLDAMARALKRFYGDHWPQ